MGPLPGPSVGRAKHQTTSVLVQPFSVQLRPHKGRTAHPHRRVQCRMTVPLRGFDRLFTPCGQLLTLRL